MIRGIVILLLTLLGAQSFAHMSSEEEIGNIGAVSEAYLESPIALLKGVGSYKLNMASSVSDHMLQQKAIAYTEQGIALNHAFQWEDAVRSFYEALRIDPKMTRAYLGLTQSFSNLNRDDALGLQKIVVKLMQNANESAALVSSNEEDRRWVDLLQIYYAQTLSIVPQKFVSQVAQDKAFTTSSAQQQLSLLVVKMMENKDPEVYAFVGWDLGSYQALDEGLKIFPQHMGLLHYLTHVNENTGKYQKAANYAKAMVALAPDAPHITHMYGHVLPMIGKWEEANEYFLKSHCVHTAVLRINDGLCNGITVDAPMSSYTPQPEELWHYSHNLELFGFSLMRTRDLASAEKIFAERCRIGGCNSLLQFYMGEGMYEKVIQTVDGFSVANNDFYLIKVQALIGLKKVSQAQALYDQLPSGNSLEDFSTQLMLAFAKTEMTSSLETNLQSFLGKVVQNPNFDTWSHILPVLRKLHNVGYLYQADEKDAIYEAIQKIDKGHPLSGQ